MKEVKEVVRRRCSKGPPAQFGRLDGWLVGWGRGEVGELLP